MLKRIIKSFKAHLKPHPNIKLSSVQYPGLILPTAKVYKSKIAGDVRIGSFSWVANAMVRRNIVVGEHSKIIDAQLHGNITMGRWTTFNGLDSDIFALVNNVVIGNFCSIARNVSIQEYDHNFQRLTSYFISANFFKESILKDIISKCIYFIRVDHIRHKSSFYRCNFQATGNRFRISEFYSRQPIPHH